MSKKYYLPQFALDILKEKGWSQAELARRASVSPTAISDMISGKAKGGYKLALAISEAGKRPPEEALQAVGLMDVKLDDDETSVEIIHIAKMLDEPNRQELLDYAKHRLEIQEREQRGKQHSRTTSHNKSPG